MTRRSIAVVCGALVTALVILFPGFALAKGASEATITGPGLDGPISLAGEGQPGGEQLMQIAEAAGFFQAVFGQVPSTMLSEQPEGTLGPRFTITYVMPGPNNELDRLRQDVYPYAAPVPLTYTAPDQPFWTTERTRGGWFVASSALRDQLVAVGLPDEPTTGAADDGTPWTTVGALAAALTLLGIVVAVVFRRGRGRASGAPAAG